MERPSAVERIFSGFLEVDYNKKDKDGVKWGDLFKMTDTYRLRSYPLILRKEMMNEACLREVTVRIRMCKVHPATSGLCDVRKALMRGTGAVFYAIVPSLQRESEIKNG